MWRTGVEVQSCREPSGGDLKGGEGEGYYESNSGARGLQICRSGEGMP